MFDHESRKEDARAERDSKLCPECDHEEKAYILREWTCPQCDNFTRCPECHYCRECDRETEPMSDLGRLLFDLGASMMRDGR